MRSEYLLTRVVLLLSAFCLAPSALQAQTDAHRQRRGSDAPSIASRRSTARHSKSGSLRDKRQRLFNVFAYGAAADGSTDDAYAFAAAYAAASAARGGTVYAPRGTYLIGSKLTLPVNVGLRGAGIGATVLKRKSTYDGDLIWSGPGTGAAFNAALQDFTIDGSYPARTGGKGVEIRIAGPRTRIQRIETKNPGYQAISADMGSNSQITDCVITGNGSAATGPAAMGIWAADKSIKNLTIARSKITNWTVNGIFGGATNLIVDSNYLANNHIQNSPVGGGQIATNPSGSIRVVNNRIDAGGGSATVGLEINNIPWYVAYNTITGQQAHGILLAGGTGHVLIGNKVSGSGIEDFSSAIPVSAWRGWANSPPAANNSPGNVISGSE